MRPSRSAQWQARVQWAEPVTGSSSIPKAGAKKRLTKSASSRSERAVTRTPRTGNAASALKLGFKPRTAEAEATSTKRSSRLRPTQTAGTPRASSSPEGTGIARAGWAGKSMMMRAFPDGPSSRQQWSGPLRVSKHRGCEAVASPVSHKACAVARVAWPHKSTSALGVNQRSRQRPGSKGIAKAVSDRFSSAATDCIQDEVASGPGRHTAAGLPRKASRVNASTTHKGRGMGQAG